VYNHVVFALHVAFEIVTSVRFVRAHVTGEPFLSAAPFAVSPQVIMSGIALAATAHKLPGTWN
jgi:hypothetical protein